MPFVPLIVSLSASWLAFVLLIPRLDASGLTGRDMHKLDQPSLPEMGGLGIVHGFVPGILLAVALDTFFPGLIAVDTVTLLAVLATVLIVTLIGIMDDLLNISQFTKTILPLLAALPLVAIEAGQTMLLVPFLGRFVFGVAYALVLVPLGSDGCGQRRQHAGRVQRAGGRAWPGRYDESGDHRGGRDRRQLRDGRRRGHHSVCHRLPVQGFERGPQQGLVGRTGRRWAAPLPAGVARQLSPAGDEAGGRRSRAVARSHADGGSKPSSGSSRSGFTSRSIGLRIPACRSIALGDHKGRPYVGARLRSARSLTAAMVAKCPSPKCQTSAS